MAKKQAKKEKITKKTRLERPFNSIKKRWQSFMRRRPHRSFRLTRRRDYRRPIKIKGYFAFTGEVFRMLWSNKRVFGAFLALYAILSVVLVGLTSNENYRNLGEYVQNITERAEASALAEIAILFTVTASGSLDTGRTEVQHMLSGLLFLFGWLVMVWILRQRIAGHMVKLRDALYSAGAPIVATFLVFLTLVLQSLPIILGIIAYTILISVGLFQEGVEAMLAWTILALLATLSLYWMTSSFIALVIVTIPGMYPFRALKTAGDLVVGRRSAIMLRLVWLLLLIAIVWVAIVPLSIWIDQWIQLDWLPLVPIVVLLVSTLTLMVSSTYVYLLYRRLIDDDTPPA